MWIHQYVDFYFLYKIVQKFAIASEKSNTHLHKRTEYKILGLLQSAVNPETNSSNKDEQQTHKHG